MDFSGEEKPLISVDGDLAYWASRNERYEGTPVRRAFDTFANPPEFELYDLENDPVEFENLAAKPEYREVKERLTRALLEYRKRTDDPFLDPEFMERIRKRATPPKQ